MYAEGRLYVYVDLELGRGSVPLTLALFKGRLYFYFFISFSSF